MAMRSNPYYTPPTYNPERALGSAVQGLGSLFAGPSPEEQAKAALVGSQMRQSAASAALAEDTLAGRSPQAAAFMGAEDLFNPEGAMNTQRLGDIFAYANRAKMDPGQIVNTLTALRGNPDQIRRGAVAARMAIGKDFAPTTSESDRISARNAAEVLNRNLAVQAAEPLTSDQLQAKTLSSQYSPEQLGQIFISDMLGQPKNVILPGEAGSEPQKTMALGNMFVDESGALRQIPFGAQIESAASRATPMGQNQLVGPAGVPLPPGQNRLFEYQGRTAGFARRAALANEAFSKGGLDTQKEAINPVAELLSGSPIGGQFMSRVVRSPSQEVQVNNAAEFIRAKLRKESGAAISQSEWDTEYPLYFPVYGDSDEVIKNKERLRNTVIDTLKKESTGGYEYLFGNQPPMGQPTGPADTSGVSGLSDEELLRRIYAQ